MNFVNVILLPLLFWLRIDWLFGALCGFTRIFIFCCYNFCEGCHGYCYWDCIESVNCFGLDGHFHNIISTNSWANPFLVLFIFSYSMKECVYFLSFIFKFWYYCLLFDLIFWYGFPPEFFEFLLFFVCFLEYLCLLTEFSFKILNFNV